MLTKPRRSWRFLLGAVLALLALGAQHDAHGFVLAHSARYGLAVEVPGSASSWCAPDLSFRLVADTATNLTRDRIADFVGSALARLLAAHCPHAATAMLIGATGSTELFQGEARLRGGNWQLVRWEPFRAPTQNRYEPEKRSPAEAQEVQRLEVVEPVPPPEPSPALARTGANFCGGGAGLDASLALGMAVLEGARSGDVALPIQTMTELANGGFPLEPPPGGFPRSRVFGEWIQREGGRTFVLQIDPDGHWRWYRVEPSERDSWGQIRVLRSGIFTLHPSTYPFALCLTYQIPERAGPFLALLGVVDGTPDDETIQLAILTPNRTGVTARMLLGRSERELCREVYRKTWWLWRQAGLHQYRIRLFVEDIQKNIEELKGQLELHLDFLKMKQDQLTEAERKSREEVVLFALRLVQTAVLEKSPVASGVIGATLSVLDEIKRPPEERSMLRAVAATVHPYFGLLTAGTESLEAAARAWRIAQEYEDLRDAPEFQRIGAEIMAMKSAAEQAMHDIYAPFFEAQRPLIDEAAELRCERFFAEGDYPSSHYHLVVDVEPPKAR